MTQSTTPLAPIVLEKQLAAHPEKVFQAWTTPEKITQWFGCGEHRMKHAEMDVRVGGSYRFEMENAGEPACNVYGSYMEIEPGKKLVFSWSNTDEERLVQDTVVTILFEPNGEGTLLKLSHAGFLTTEGHTDHNEGWIAVIDSLVTYFPA